MFQFKKIFSIIVLLFLFFPLTSRAESNQVNLYFFEGQGCPYCAKMKSFLEGLKTDYSNLKVYDFEVYFNAENQALFRKMAEAYGTDTGGVPTIFIDNEVIEGVDFEKVKNAVERCSWQVCISPASKIGATTNENQNGNTDQSADGGKTRSEIIGWVVIGVIVLTGLILIIYSVKKKTKH